MIWHFIYHGVHREFIIIIIFSLCAMLFTYVFLRNFLFTFSARSLGAGHDLDSSTKRAKNQELK